MAAAPEVFAVRPSCADHGCRHSDRHWVCHRHAVGRAGLPSGAVTRRVLPHMLVRQRGRIINASSVTGPMVGTPGEAAYGAAKAAMVGMSRALALEVAKQASPSTVWPPAGWQLALIVPRKHERPCTRRSDAPAHRLKRPRPSLSWPCRAQAISPASRSWSTVETACRSARDERHPAPGARLLLPGPRSQKVDLGPTATHE